MRKATYTAQVTIYLTQDVYEKIKEITDDHDISMAEFLRAATEEYLSEWDVSEQKKLI